MSYQHTGLSAEERFWIYTQKGAGCWLWRGAPTGPNGYGQLRVNGKKMGAHRFSYMLATGNDPGGLLVCHHCDAPLCVNPAHLFIGTVKDNTADAMKKERFRPREYRAARKIELGGEMLCAAEVGRRIGVNEATIRKRLSGETKTVPIAAPACRPDVLLTFKGETLNIKQWADRVGLSIGAIQGRRARGWPIDMVLSSRDYRDQSRRGGVFR